MAGVFGAGVAAWLIEAGFEDNHKIEAMYGSSAGVFTEAYYASKQPLPLGPSIYWEDLIKNFILVRHIPFGTFQRFCQRYFGHYPGKLVHAVDIDLLMGIISKGNKALDLKAVQDCPFPLYVKVWDLKNRYWLFVDLRTYHNSARLLKASVSVIPYFFSSEDIENSKCVDLCLTDPLNLNLITARHPGSKIIFVVNHVHKMRFLLLIARLLEGVVANWCFPEINPMCFIKGLKKYKEDIKKIKGNPDMLLMTPPSDFSVTSYTTDPVKLLKAYEIGKREAQKIMDFAKHQSTAV